MEMKGGWMGLLAGLGLVQKISPPRGFELWTFLTLDSHCTDYVFPAHGRVYLENLGVGGTTHMKMDLK
jgi:hypothetical protein